MGTTKLRDADYIVTGMGFGDEGKGQSTDFICSQISKPLVVKCSGGHQAGHRVVALGKTHVFSQVGAGALAGAPTHIDSQFIVELASLRGERRVVEQLGGNSDVTVSSQCPVTLPYHVYYNRYEQLFRGFTKTTCGKGIGATRETQLNGVGVTLGDILKEDCLKKVLQVRDYLLSKSWQGRPSSFEVRNSYESFLNSMELCPLKIVETLRECASELSRTKRNFEDYNLVFENSQGVLLDENWGVDDYCTFSTVTPRNAKIFLRQLGREGISVGILRSYLSRHGEGNFKGVELEMAEDVNNPYNDFQGSMKYWKWPAYLLEYAFKLVKPDLVFMTHLDRYKCDLPVNVNIESYGPDRSDRILS